MSYLLDKKIRRKKIINVSLVLILLAFFVYFFNPIASFSSSVMQTVFKPFINLSNFVKNKKSNIDLAFSSKESLFEENELLKNKIKELDTKMTNYTTLFDENTKLKEILNRKKEENKFMIAGILSKSSSSIYGTLLIDAGEIEGVKVDSIVFALGNIPIGKIAEVFPHSSKVLLFSTPGESTEVVIAGKDVFIQAIGRGIGNFEISLPRDFSIEKDTQILLPGINSYVLANVVDVISDPRDSFKKALLASPINIEQLRFVEIEKK